MSFAVPFFARSIFKTPRRHTTPTTTNARAREMAPPAAPAGHRPIQSFFRGVHELGSTSTAFPEAPAPAPAAPPPSSVPAGCVPAWDRPNDRPLVAYARRRRGARAGDATNAGSREASGAKRPRVSDDRDRAVEDTGEGRGPSSSGRPERDEPEGEPKKGVRAETLDLPRARNGKTKQLFLDLGQKSFGHVTCPTCGLLYAKGEREDERTHATYHAAHVEAEGFARDNEAGDVAGRSGGKFGLACPRRWGFESAAWRSPGDDEWLVVCGRRDHAKRREVARKIAAHVEKTLGMRAGWALEKASAKMFCYVAGDRVVGALVAEPLRGAFRTVPPVTTTADTKAEPPEISAPSVSNASDEGNARARVRSNGSITRRSDALEPATLGVRALWTHPAWRRRGVASKALNVARHVLTAGYVSGVSECAFTQPTEAGKRFAQKSCGREDGTFLVYLPE